MPRGLVETKVVGRGASRIGNLLKGRDMKVESTTGEMVWVTLVAIMMLGAAIMLQGCGTLRGATALVGGIGADISQGSQHVRDHTSPNESPRYKGAQR